MSIDINIENYITDYLANKSRFIIKFFPETENYIFFISSSYSKSSDRFMLNFYKKNTKSINGIYFSWNINIILNGRAIMKKEEYDLFLEQNNIDSEILAFMINNQKCLVVHKPHSNYPLPYIKNGENTIEEAIREIYLKDIICTRVLAESTNNIVVLCEENKYDGKPYIKDLIGITYPVNETGAEYKTEIKFYEISKFFNNLDNNFFDDSITIACNNSDKLSTLRMLQ